MKSDEVGEILRSIGELQGTVTGVDKSLTEHREQHRRDVDKLHDRINGQRERVDALATAQATKRILPTGGVHKPMQRFNTIMMPKCSGDMPKLTATGRKIGVKISTAGVMSMKMPTINKTRLISNRMMMGLSLSATMALATVAGMFS